MFSLIITVISIALALVLVLAVLYYGSEAFGKHADKVLAETLVNQSVQIASAQQVARAQGLSLPPGETIVLPTSLLSTMPVPPKAAYASGDPAPSDWKTYVPGAAGHFGLQAKLSKRACMAVNKAQGFLGIPAVWDGTSSVQCFGARPEGYTYLYQPGGQTQEQRDAVIDKSLGEAQPNPDAKPGYPRLCPDDTTITEGICGNGSGSTPPPPAKTGFWVLSATVDYYSTPVIISEGYAATCPADAINPTTSAAHPAPSAPGEQFNVDGAIELGWYSMETYTSPFTSDLSRKWCLPALEADVVNTGDISGEPSSGAVINPVLTVNPASTSVEPDDYSGATNAAVVLSANGVKWTLLASGFEVDLRNKANGATQWLLGRKVAIGKTETATQSHFLASPPLTDLGITYQYQSGTITFTPKPPKMPASVCDPVLNITTPGVGGAIVDLQSYESTNVMLKADGSVWATGGNWYGNVGVCHEEDVLTWTRVATNVANMSAPPSQAHTYVTKRDGSLWLSGRVMSHEAGPGYGDNFANSDFLRMDAANVAEGGGGSQYSALRLKDGTIWFTGYNAYSQAGGGRPMKEVINSFVQVDSGAVSMTATFGNIYYLKSDNSLWTTGATHAGHLGYEDNVSLGTMYPKKVASNVSKVAGDQVKTVYITTDGRAFGAGEDSWALGAFGFGNQKFYFPAFTQLLPEAGRIVDVTVDWQTIKLLGADGRLWAAGGNSYGYFADGTRSNSLVFKVIATNVAKFTVGGVVLDKSGVLWGIGDNSVGQYGDGTTEGSDSTYKRITY